MQNVNYFSEHDSVDVVFQQLSDHVTQYGLNIENFWKSSAVIITEETYQKYLNDIGFSHSSQDFLAMVELLKNSDDMITLENLCQNVKAWNDQNGFMIEFIKQKAQKIAQGSLKNLDQKSTKLRPLSGRNQSMTSIKSKFTNLTELRSQITQDDIIKQNLNKSKQYLSQHKNKQKEQERLLQMTITRGKNEFEYQCLLKMGQANDYSQQLQSKITYRAYKNANGNLKVHVYDLNTFQRELTLDEFNRELNIVKNQFISQRKNRIWEQKTIKTDGSIKKILLLDEQSKMIDKKDRQQELKQVLLDTMMLSNILKDQLKILQRKKNQVL